VKCVIVLFTYRADKQNDESVHSIGWRGMTMKLERTRAERLEAMKKGIEKMNEKFRQSKL
jgi:hypothetical protein